MREKAKNPLDVFGLREIYESAAGELIAGDLRKTFSGFSIDSRTIKNGEVFIAVKGARFNGHDFIQDALNKGAGCIVASKNEPLYFGAKLPEAVVLVEDTLKALEDLAYYQRKRFAIPIIAITGSNGKTTTKEMLSCLLGSRYNVLKNEGTRNNIIGVCLSLLNLKSRHDMAVLEFGTNHFGEISKLARIAAPNVGIITNIGPAHLEYFKDESGVLKEKWSLIEDLAFPRIAVINTDDPYLLKKMNSINESSGKITGPLESAGQPSNIKRFLTGFSFGIRGKADFRGVKISRGNKKTVFYINNLPICLNTPLRINVYNALAAYAAARIFSVDGYDIIKRFAGFRFPPARFQMNNINGLNVINDSYNANPDSMRCAIEAFSNLPVKGRRIAVIGDMLELGSRGEWLHRETGKNLCKAKIDFIIGVGSLSHIACDAALACGFDAKAVYKCFSIIDARSLVQGLAKKGDSLLLKGSRAMRLDDILENSHNSSSA